MPDLGCLCAIVCVWLFFVQTRVDSVNINNPLAMTKLFQSGWEQKLRPLQ
jgi:hypothetical protein